MPEPRVSSPTPQPPARDATWDIARGIGMALVIYAHFLEPIYPGNADAGRAFVQGAFTQWQAVYSFHMMLFFLVSGAVNRNLPKKAFPDVLRGSLRLLALAWIVHLLGIVVVFARGGLPDTAWDVLVAVFDPILEGYCWSVGVLWFLTSLCFVQLLAYGFLRFVPAPAVVIAAILATVAVVYFDAPNQYLFRTWMPGLSFFALGYLLAQYPIRWPVVAAPFLFAAVIWLAPLNDGCAYTLQDACARWAGPFGVRMFGGNYGFLPLFFLTALIGTLSVVCLSAGLAKFKAGAVLAYMGRASLDLFVINGFVATFLPPLFARIDASQFTVVHYVVIGVALIGAHLAAVWALSRPLGLLDEGALRIAKALTSRLGTAKSAATA